MENILIPSPALRNNDRVVGWKVEDLYKYMSVDVDDDNDD